jgi:hypothetical protein
MALTWLLERDGSTGEDVKTVQYLSDETQLNSRASAAANSSAVSSCFSNIAPSCNSRSARSALLLLGEPAGGVALLVLTRISANCIRSVRASASFRPRRRPRSPGGRGPAIRSMSSPRSHHYTRLDGAAIPLAGLLAGLASVGSPHVLILDNDTGD